MFHILKPLLSIIDAPIRRKGEENLEKLQFGFSNTFGSVKYCLVQCFFTEILRPTKGRICVYLDYEKAFDQIHQYKLIEMLEDFNLDERDMTLKNLY